MKVTKNAHSEGVVGFRRSKTDGRQELLILHTHGGYNGIVCHFPSRFSPSHKPHRDHHEMYALSSRNRLMYTLYSKLNNIILMLT